MSLDQLYLLPPGLREKILNGPALTPPPNVIPNFDNPPNNNRAVIVSTIVCQVIVAVAMIIRTYAQAFVGKRLYIEDAFGYAAFALANTLAYSCYRWAHSAGFAHQWDIRVRDLSEILYVSNLAYSLYSATMMTLKAAILLEWARILAPRRTNRSFYWACNILLGINILFYLSVIIARELSCTPRQRIWDKTVPGTCIQASIIPTTTASINCVSDILILILPQRIIWKLKMSPKKKLGLSLVFGLGIMAVLASIARLVTSVQTSLSADMTYTAFSQVLSTHYEVTFGFLVFCVPAIPRIFTQGTLFSRILASLGSWSSLLSRKSTPDEKSAQTDPHSVVTIPESSYRKIGEDEMSLGHLRKSSVGTTDSLDQSSYARGSLTPFQVDENGVVRTTFVEIREKSRQGSSTSDSTLFPDGCFERTS